MRFVEHFVEAAGYRTCYLDEGVGDVVLLLHSVDPGCSGWLEFRNTIEPLSRQFRVVVPDLLGFAKTSGPERAISEMSAEYVKHVLAFMDALHIEKAHLVGNSRGGLIAIAIAAQEPQRVSRLILLGNAGGGVTAEYLAKTEAAYANFRPVPDQLRAFLSDSFYDLDRSVPTNVFDVYLSNAVAQHERQVKAGATFSDVPDLRETLGTLRLPILYIFGREDRRWPPLEDALAIFSSTPHAQFFVLSQCGHHPQTEWPDSVNGLALQFLQHSPEAPTTTS